jgi:hypothetical protein
MQNKFEDGLKLVDVCFLMGWRAVDSLNVWYVTDVLIIGGCRIHIWTDVLHCFGGKCNSLTIILVTR